MNKRKDLEMVPCDDQGGWGTYTHASFMFAFCGKVEGNSKVKQITAFEDCRESLICRIFDRNTYDIPTYRLRCLVRVILGSNAKKGRDLFEKRTKAGLRVLNIMEKHNGWPLTKMLNVEVQTLSSYPKRTVFTKMLEGSNKWMKSPHMLSLFFLLYRLPAGNAAFLLIKNYKQLKKACGKYSAGTATSGDKRNVRNTLLFWDPLMSDFGKMFRGLPLKSNFNKSNYKPGYYDEGISKLCTFQTNNKKISERFVALASKVEGAKIPK